MISMSVEELSGSLSLEVLRASMEMKEWPDTYISRVMFMTGCLLIFELRSSTKINVSTRTLR